MDVAEVYPLHVLDDFVDHVGHTLRIVDFVFGVGHDFQVVTAAVLE